MMHWYSSIARLLWVLRVLVKHSSAHAAGRFARRFAWVSRLIPGTPLSGPERLRAALEEMGGTFIKFGQMLALQPDILPLEYCDALFSLLDRVTPFPIEEVDRTFREETGKIPAEIFDCFDPKPIATASIGQVHVATLDGRKLAVKVQRPRVAIDFGGDIHMMTAAIHWIRRLHLRPLFWLIEPMSEFAGWTREELDYRYEARYMEQLRHNSRNNAREHVPEVLWEHTSRRTLVAEFLDGCTVLASMRALQEDNREVLDWLDDSSFDSHAVASNIIDNFLGDAFEHGIFHADLHPANLMILPGNVVGYVDFGITGVISLYSRQNLIALTLAYTRGDIEGMCESFFKVSAIGPQSDIPAFRSGLREAGEGWYEAGGGNRRLRKNFTLVMLDMLRLSRQTGIWPERDVIKYIRSAIAIDGLITRLAPTFDLAGHLGTACDRYLKWQVRRSLATFDNLIGWASSGGSIFRDGALRAADALGKAIAGGIHVSGQPEGVESSSPGLRQRMMYLGCFVFTICFAASLPAERIQLGINLFTAEAALGTCAFALLVGTVSKL
jgi:ubiquinone biosynthesis protein